jgi:hypothetical protein
VAAEGRKRKYKVEVQSMGEGSGMDSEESKAAGEAITTG